MALEFTSYARADFMIVKRVPPKDPASEGTVRTFSSVRGGDYGNDLAFIEAEIQLLMDGLQHLSDRRDAIWERVSRESSNSQEETNG